MIHIMGRFLLEASSRRNGLYETRLILFLLSYPRTAFPSWNTSLTLELPCSRGIEILYHIIFGKRERKEPCQGPGRGSLHCQCGRKAAEGEQSSSGSLASSAASIGGCHLRQGMDAVMVTAVAAC